MIPVLDQTGKNQLVHTSPMYYKSDSSYHGGLQKGSVD